MLLITMKKGEKKEEKQRDEKVFILRLDINVEDVIKKYSFIEQNKGTIKYNIINIDNIDNSDGNYWTIMKDLESQKYVPIATNKKCWWCRQNIINSPIGIPLFYNYNSSNIPDFQTMIDKMNLTTSSGSDKYDFFETEGLFCSFSCCKAYILDRIIEPKYSSSLSLLTFLYHRINNIKNTKVDFEPTIPTAPSWKLLIEYGGNMSYELFNKIVEKYQLITTPNIKRPFMFNVLTYVECIEKE